MSAVAELKALMGIDTGQYKAGVKEVITLTSSFQKSISGIGGMLAGAFSVGAIIAFGKGLMGVADNMKNMAEGMNSTMGVMTAMKTIGAENNLNWEEMSKVLGKVRDAQGAVVNLSKTQSDALERLNINANDFVGAGVEKALEMIANAYVKANGSALALNAVNDLFGAKIGPRAIEMLKAMDAEGLGPLAERTKEATKGFEELAAAQSTIEKFFNGVQLKVASLISKFGELKQISGAVMDRLAGNITTEEMDRRINADPNAPSFGERVRSGRDKIQALLKSKYNVEDKISSENPDVAKMKQNQAAKDKIDADKANEKAQELGRRYYFKELKNQDEIESLYADYAKEGKGLSKIKGQGAAADNMMRIGGLVGGARPGLAAEDRQLRVQQESKELLREMSIKLQKLIDKQDIERDRNEG